MATYKDMKDAIARIKNIEADGFDNEWVLRAAAREIALKNIELIKPYTTAENYNLIVRYIVTGDESIREGVRRAAAYAAAAYAAAYAAAADAAAYAAYAAADADAADARSASYAESIEMLNRIADEYLERLVIEAPVEEMTVEQVCMELGRKVRIVDLEANNAAK